MNRYAVLLRGINVGKANRVGMADLRALLTAEGYGNVRTLLQSGNIVLDAEAPAPALARSVAQALEKRFRVSVSVIVRTPEELQRVVETDPLGDVATDGARYLVAFLAEPADPSLEERLAAIDIGDERCVVDGAEVYAWCPGGVRDSRLMAALGKIPGAGVTVRNWNTVQKLVGML